MLYVITYMMVAYLGLLMCALGSNVRGPNYGVDRIQYKPVKQQGPPWDYRV
jgi:hypothetical protein